LVALCVSSMFRGQFIEIWRDLKALVSKKNQNLVS
jgi:hypothetical protein